MRVSGLSFVMPLLLSMTCCRSLFRKQPLTVPDISSITMQLYNLGTSSKEVKTKHPQILACRWIFSFLMGRGILREVINICFQHGLFESYFLYAGSAHNRQQEKNMSTSVVSRGIPDECAGYRK